MAQHQAENKQSMSKLAGSLRQLEDRLHELMARQPCSEPNLASNSKQHGLQGKLSSSVDGSVIAAARGQSASSEVRSEDKEYADIIEDEVALAQKAAHVAKWVQQSGTAQSSQQHPTADANHTDGSSEELFEQQSQQAQHSINEEQHVSCHLSQHDTDVSLDLQVRPGQDAQTCEKLQRAAQTRYEKWSASVSIVEDACSQLKVRNHNPGPGAKSASYAQLLLECASDVLQ